MDPTPRHSITSFMKKVTESSSLQKQFQENDKYFQTKLQVARFSKNEMFKKNPPAVYAGKDKLGRAVFYITGLLIPDSGKPEYEVWIQHFVTLIDERLGDKPYLIVFFNTNLMTHSRLSDFKELMGQMPLKCYTQLEGFIVMHANFLVKSGHFLTSSDLCNFLKKRTEFIDSLNQMSKQTWFDYGLLEKLPAEIKKYDTSFKDILKRQERSKSKQDLQQKGLNVPLSDDDDEDEFDKNSKILGKDLSFYELNTHKFPILLDILIQYFTQNQQYMLSEGIFRKQAAVYEERILEAAIANKKLKFIQRIDDPNIVAGVFKQFFIQLPTPIVTYAVHKSILDETKGKLPSDIAARLVLCQTISNSIPPLNNIIFAVCLDFLRQITKYDEHNRMTVYNMGVVFAPCFFRAPQLSMMDLQNAQYSFFVELTEFFIAEFDQLFPNFDYRSYLTSIVDNKRHSMIPYLPDDTANMQDFSDMQSDFKFADMDEADRDSTPVNPQMQAQQAQQLQAQLDQMKLSKMLSPKSASCSRSSSLSDKHNDDFEDP